MYGNAQFFRWKRVFKDLGTVSLSNVSVAYFGHLLATCVGSLLKQMAF